MVEKREEKRHRGPGRQNMCKIRGKNIMCWPVTEKEKNVKEGTEQAYLQCLLVVV